MATPTQNPPPDATEQPFQATTNQQQEVEIRQVGGVEFVCIEPSHLWTVPVMVQALDNQWVSRSLLQKVMRRGELTESIERTRRKQVRAEYIRALINGQQVVLNRAYLFNSRTVSQDYFQKGAKREAFKALLQEGVIVPYLFTENAPVDPPSSGEGTDSSFEPDPRVAKWREVCQEVRMHCVRLSWNDKDNWESARQQLSERFNRFAASASMGDIKQYLRDLGVDPDDPSAESSLRKRLVEMGRLCQDYREQGKYVTREILYQKFITAGRPSVERKYDTASLFGGEVKQLLDLAYNSYLPDALGGYLLTPIDTLQRTALQEWQQAMNQPHEITAEELMTLLRRMSFALVQGGLYLQSMHLLGLQDVREIRDMEEWIEYIESLKALLERPLEFADGGAARVYQNYDNLAKKMTGLIRQRYTQRMDELVAPWTPAIELVIDIAGATLSIMGTSAGPVYKCAGEVSSNIGGKVAPVLGRLIVRGAAGVRAQADLFTSIDFMKRKMRDAQKQWNTIQRQMKEVSRFRELVDPSMRTSSEEKVPTVNYQELEY